MSDTLSILSRRLAKIERWALEREQRELSAACICRGFNPLYRNDPKVFEAEMARLCPLHGYRNLGITKIFGFVGRGNSEGGKLMRKHVKNIKKQAKKRAK